MNISFEYYQTFCVVAESKSITEAAKKLNISQPAITKTIKILETEIESILFFRNHNGMTLTTEGEKLYTYIKPIMLQLFDTKNIMNEIVKNGKTFIKIGTSITILRSFLINYIKGFMIDHPNVHISVEDNTNNNLINKIKEGSIDIAIIISNVNYIKKYSNITRYKIKDLHYSFFSSEEYLKKVGKPISIKKIKNEKFIINYNTTQINECLSKYGLNNYISVASNSFITDFIERGLGIGLVIKEFASSIANIYEIEIIEPLPNAELIAITNSNKYHNISLSHFLNGLLKK